MAFFHGRGMSVSTFAPPFVAAPAVAGVLRADGCAVLDADGLATLVDTPLAALAPLVPSWDDLRPDEYLKDGGRYRRRRHASFVVDGTDLARVAHRAHWQPLEYNALHGGMRRWFEPIADGTARDPAWRSLVVGLADAFAGVRAAPRWFVEAHQFRIDTAGGIGRPTPEGAHRDGVDFVAVILIARRGVKGGETRVFEAAGPRGERFTMTEPWTTLLLDDARVIHETTPVQPAEEAGAAHGIRDTLVLTYRAEGFQGDD
jgi:hypothetical protein